MTELASWSHNLLLALLPLAADPVPDPSEVKPGWIALVVVLALVAASVFLWFSMRKQLGKIQVPKRGDARADQDGDHDAGHGSGQGRDPAEVEHDRPGAPPVS